MECVREWMLEKSMRSTTNKANAQEKMYLLWRRFRLPYPKAKCCFTKLGSNNDTNFLSPGENTALHLAARMGDKRVVEELLNCKASLLTHDNIKGNTPLHLAASSGHVDVVESLINHAKNSGVENGGVLSEVISKRNKKGNMPLHEAVRNGHYLVTALLVDEVSLANRCDLLASVNIAGESPLSMAIDVKHYGIMKKILKANPSSLRHRGPNDQTPLHRAILRADIGIIIYLAVNGPELIYKKDSYGRTPLHYAAASGSQLTVHHLLKVDPSIALLRDNYLATPAHLAAENGMNGTLSMILNRRPDSVELLNQHSQNILHVAAQNGSTDVVKYILSLLEADDLINEPDKDGNTPLHLATMNFHSSVVQGLTLTSKLDVRVINNDGKTALDIAQPLSQEKAVDTSYDENDNDQIKEKQVIIEILKEGYAKKAENLKDKRKKGKNTFTQIEGLQRSKELSGALMVMAILIATVTFAAAFTIPGGFQSGNSHAGMAVLGKNAAFRTFIITDTIAMTSSMMATVILIMTPFLTQKDISKRMFGRSIILLWIALITMGLAFVTSLYAVLSDWLPLAIAVCSIGCIFPFLVYALPSWITP